MLGSLVSSTAIFAVSRGVSLDRIAAETGVDVAGLLEQDAWLPQEVLPAVWRLLGEAFPGRAMALEMAGTASFSFFGPLGRLARFAENLKASLQLFIRFRSVLSDDLELTLVEQGSVTALRFRHPMDAVDGGYAAEAGLGIGARILREVLHAGDALVQVEFTHRPHGPLEDYERFFGVPVAFERPFNAVLLHSEALERQTPQGDRQMQAYAQRHLELESERLAASADSGGLARLREAIDANALRAVYDSKAVAKALGMSLRNAQRVASEHGSSLRVMIEEARKANAWRLLGDPRLSIEEVAAQLGYSTDRAFRRAFERWTGMSPAQARRNPR